MRRISQNEMILTESSSIVLVEQGTGEQQAKDAALEIERNIRKVFPNSHVDVGLVQSLGDYSIDVEFALGKDSSEWDFAIMRNDPLLTQVTIEGDGDMGILNKDGTLATNFKTDLISGGKILSRENEGFRSKSIKVGFRSTKGNLKKMIDSLNSYFVKLKKVAKDNKDQIRDGRKAVELRLESFMGEFDRMLELSQQDQEWISDEVDIEFDGWVGRVEDEDIEYADNYLKKTRLPHWEKVFKGQPDGKELMDLFTKELNYRIKQWKRKNK